MVVVETKALRRIGASALTAYPFVFIDPELSDVFRALVLDHEKIHLEQQKRWLIRGLGIGLLAWFWLYLVGLPLGLPAGWNPWRWKWEREAFLAQGLPGAEVSRRLRGKPYFLWWHYG